MTAGHTQTDVLSRVRREQRMRGKTSTLSGFRIVLGATAITVAMLLAAFGAIGLLLKARAPQQPIASRFDPMPPVLQQSETPAEAPINRAATSTHEKTPELEEVENKDGIEKKSVKALRVVAPPAPPAEQNNVVAQDKKSATEPEVTGTVPQQRVEPQPQVRKQNPVRRPPPESQSDNPLFELFGIKKYR